jgi:TPR repeat protein
MELFCALIDRLSAYGLLGRNGDQIMNSKYKIIKFQSKILLAVGLLVVFSTALMAIPFQGHETIDNKVNALTPQDIPALRQKAQDGDVTAQYMIGRACYLGKGTARDYGEALKWYRKAAEQGNTLAQFALSIMYSQGQGTLEDAGESLKWAQKAAEGGLANAQFFWGYFIEQSQRDYSQAAKWYRKAAEQGVIPAQNAMGFLYEQGKGVHQDLKEAVMWYRKAAEQGDANAQSNLGSMYSAGRGVGQDFNEAAKWFRLSAEQGWAPGQGNLAGLYVQGQGVPRDLLSAYMWCSLAALAGVLECKELLQALEPKLKIEEINEAKRRAFAWSQAHPEKFTDIGQAGDARGQPQVANVAASETTRKDAVNEKLRARAVEVVTALESDPLSNKAKEYRKEMKQLMNDKELGVTLLLCMPVLQQDILTDKEYSEEMLAQFMYSQVKFSIQHPEKAQDLTSLTVAGIEGALLVYTAVKMKKPNTRFTSLENLLQKRQSGLLADHIRSKGC